jgi:hypothetical protein
MGLVAMTQTALNTLSRPWRKFPQILGFYAVIWVVGAVALTLIHIAFDEPATQPQAPNFEIPKPPEGNKHEPVPQAVANAWNAARASNDINTLNIFISRFPTSQYAEEARKLINNLEQADKMQVADADAGIRVVAQLLENKDTKPASLDAFITSNGFDKKYPLGFVLFYSDGRKTLYYPVNTNNDVQFDPSTIRALRLTAMNFCFSGFSATLKGTHLIMEGNCLGAAVGSVVHLMSLNGVTIGAESLGGSAAGAAWIIGLAP